LTKQLLLEDAPKICSICLQVVLASELRPQKNGRVDGYHKHCRRLNSRANVRTGKLIWAQKYASLPPREKIMYVLPLDFAKLTKQTSGQQRL